MGSRACLIFSIEYIYIVGSLDVMSVPVRRSTVKIETRLERRNGTSADAFSVGTSSDGRRACVSVRVVNEGVKV